MNKKNKILSCIQILAILSIIICNGSITVNIPQKYTEFPCKEHQCGCKSEPDCKKHCCCGFYGDRHTFQGNNKEEKKVLHAFISSMHCKYGNDPLTKTTITAEYKGEEKTELVKESFSSFLFYSTPRYPSDIIASPPEKPPRYSA